MKFRSLIFLIAITAVFAMAARYSIGADTWWHLRAGQWIVEHRAVLRTDLFSYTRGGQPWHYPGWLVEAPMYLIFRQWGAGGLNLWTAGMVALTFAFVWMTMQGSPYLRVFLLIFSAVVSAVYWSARPYLVTFLLAAVFLWLLERVRAGEPPRFWLFFLLMVIWVNSHGGFAVGFLLWGAILAGALLESFGSRDFRQVKTLLLVGVVLALAVPLNPSGLEMFAYPFKTVRIGVLQDFIQEWQSPNFHQINVQPFVWALLFLLGVFGFSRRRVALADFFLLAGFGYLALMAGRNIALFALVFPMVASKHLEPVLLQSRIYRQIAGRANSPLPARLNRLNWIVAVLVLLTGLVKAVSVYPAAFNRQAEQQVFPVQAVQALRQQAPAGRMFNAYNWGAYLLWTLPEQPVFVDGRTDLYGDEILSQWLQVMRAKPGWQQILAGWQVNWAFLPANAYLIPNLQAAGWQVFYQDEKAVIYEKK